MYRDEEKYMLFVVVVNISLFYVLSLRYNIVLFPRIIVFEEMILLSCWFHCFMCPHCVRVLYWVLGLWCLKR